MSAGGDAVVDAQDVHAAGYGDAGDDDDDSAAGIVDDVDGADRMRAD